MNKLQKIIEFLKSKPGCWYVVSDFMKSYGEVPFIGYTASVYLTLLTKKKILITRPSTLKPRNGNRPFSEYAISPEYLSSTPQ